MARAEGPCGLDGRRGGVLNGVKPVRFAMFGTWSSSALMCEVSSLQTGSSLRRQRMNPLHPAASMTQKRLPSVSSMIT